METTQTKRYKTNTMKLVSLSSSSSAAAVLALLSISAMAPVAVVCQNTKVRLSNQPATYWGLPPYIAQQEGYFSALGLDVEFVTYPSGAPQVNDATNWDMGATGTSPAIIGASLDIYTIGISNDESAANALVGSNNAAWPLASIDDVPFYVSPSSTGQFAVEACMTQAGFSPATATYVGSSQNEIISTLEDSEEAAYGGLWAPNTYQLLENTPGSVQLCTAKDAGATVPGAIIVNKAFAESSPDVVAKVLSAWLRGINFINDPDNRDAAINYQKEFYATFQVSISDVALENEIDTRPLFGLDDQIRVMEDEAGFWFTSIATFLEENGQLASVPAFNTYIKSRYLLLVQNDETLSAYANGEDVDPNSSAGTRFTSLTVNFMSVSVVASSLVAIMFAL